MYEEINYDYLFSWPSWKGYLDAVESFMAIYAEIALALFITLLIVLIALSIVELRRDRTIKPARVLKRREPRLHISAYRLHQAWNIFCPTPAFSQAKQISLCKLEEHR